MSIDKATPSLLASIGQYLGLGITMKLVLAMTLLVSIACAATVWFVEVEARRTFQRFCEQQFDTQWQIFLGEEAHRLSEAKQILQEAIQLAPLSLALDRQDRDAFKSRLAEILLSILAKKGFKPNGLVRNEPFFYWISEDHKLYKPILGEAGYSMHLQAEGIRKEIDPLSISSAHRSAYLILPTAEGQLLYQLIAAPLPGEQTANDLGDLILAIPLNHLKELFGSQGKGPKPGIVFSNQLLEGAYLPQSGLADVQGVLSEVSAYGSSIRLNGTHGRVNVGLDDELYYRQVPSVPNMPQLYQLALFSLGRLHRFKHNIRIAILSIVPLVPISGLILSIVASRRMTRPIRRLVAANQRVKEGDFLVHVPVDREDELGQLSRSFNEMVDGLALKDRYRSILSQVTDKEVAERLLQGEVELGGEERNCTILFCDIRGFTHLSEHMHPATLIRLLNEHMSALADLAHTYHGVVDKFIGDAIMVIFGSPRSYGNDAYNAGQAALAMQAKRLHLNQVSDVPFEIGIGIASGRVVAGCIGSSERLNYTVVGNRVNIASRLCGKAKAGEIFIDESTRTRLGSNATVEGLPAMTLKGISEPVAVFSLKSLSNNSASIEDMMG